MNLTEMETKTRVYADDRNGDRWTGDLNSELVDAINTAQQDVADLINEADEHLFMGCYRCDVDASADAWEWDLPTDFIRLILAEREVDGGDPIPATWADFRDRHGDAPEDAYMTSPPGSPRCYMRGTHFGVVDPAEDYILRVWYTKRLPALSGPTDVSEIPLEHHDLVCLEAADILLGSIGRALSAKLDERRRRKLEQLQMSIENREQQTPEFVKHVPD